MKKKHIDEILDSDGNLIGSEDQPDNNPNEIQSMGTTDHNAAIGHQNYSHDFLGRFGFAMYNEGEGNDTSSTDELIASIAKESYMYFEGDDDNLTPYEQLSQEIKNYYNGFAQKIIGILNTKPVEKISEPTLTESEMSKMIEDVITSKTDKSITTKSGDNDILDGKLKDKLKSMISNLSPKDKGEIITHLKK